MVLGLTGKYCSGKNMAAEVFINRGWHVLDIDLFGHEALKAMSSNIIETFGDGILSGDGDIDRKKLGAIVFSNRKKLALLESLIHPYMKTRCEREINCNRHRDILINAAILHHMGLNRLCNSVLWVESSLSARFIRAKKRDELSFLQILKRIYSQCRLDAKYWPEDVDIHTIRNSNTRMSLEAEVNSLIDKFEERV